MEREIILINRIWNFGLLWTVHEVVTLMAAFWRTHMVANHRRYVLAHPHSKSSSQDDFIAFKLPIIILSLPHTAQKFAFPILHMA